MRSFVIHMSASTARRANADALCNNLPQAQIVEAVNGRDPDRTMTVTPHTESLHRPHYPFPLRPAEIGVFESHRACWQRIVDEKLDYAVITEDDLALDSKRFSQALELIKSHATPEMYIRMPVKQRERTAQVLGRNDSLQLVLPSVIGLQCICQVVGKGAAERLLDVTRDIDRPVDTLLQMHWITNQPVHTILGTGNREVAHEIGGSTIQTKTRASGKLTREIKRAWYRAQINLRPQRA